jgi:hypothetical protein
MNLLFLLSLLICEWFPSRHPHEQHLLLMFLMQKKLNKLKTLKHKNNKTIKRSSLLSLLCVCVCVCPQPFQALQKSTLMAFISCPYNTCDCYTFSRRIGLEIITILYVYKFFPPTFIYEKFGKENLSTW